MSSGGAEPVPTRDEDEHSLEGSTPLTSSDSSVATVEELKVKIQDLTSQLEVARKEIERQQLLISDLRKEKGREPRGEGPEEGDAKLLEFFASIGLSQYAAVFAKEEFDAESIMLVDENELKEMDIPRGPRLKILNRIRNRPAVPPLSSMRDSASSLASSSETLSEETISVENLQSSLSIEELEQIKEKKKQRRASWRLSDAISSAGEEAPSNGILERKLKRESLEMRRRASDNTVKSPGRHFHGTLTKKSISNFEDLISASDGSVMTRAHKERRRSGGTANKNVGENDDGEEMYGKKQVLVVDASAPIKTVKKMAITDILSRVPTMPIERQKPKKVGGVVYEYYFTGQQLIEWLLEESLATNPMDALMACSLLLQSGVIVSLARNKEFEGKLELYALDSGDSRDKRTKSVTYASVPVPEGSPKVGKKEKKEKKKKDKDGKKEKKDRRRAFSLRKSGMAILNGMKLSQADEKAYHETAMDLKPRIFKAKLGDVMALQQESDPTLPVPRILIELRRAIINARGYQTVGVFRISGNNDHVIELMGQLNESNYEVLGDVDDVHTFTTILKRWIRELPEPLIPGDSYYDAIDIVKTDGYKQPERCWEAVTKLPAINQRVIVYLIDFLRDLARPEYSAVTKMDVDNLSMVFAPLFLCCPDSSLLFSNSVYEATFVQNLLTADPDPTLCTSVSPAFSPPATTPAHSFTPSPRSMGSRSSLMSSTNSLLSSSPTLPSSSPYNSPLASSQSSVLSSSLAKSAPSPASSQGLASTYSSPSRTRQAITPRAPSPSSTIE